MSMKIFCVAALFALLTGPAYGQSVNWIPDVKSKTPEEIEQEKAKDKAYRESIRKIPDAKAASDPWGTVRGPDSRNSSAQKKPRAKTGAATGQ